MSNNETRAAMAPKDARELALARHVSRRRDSEKLGVAGRLETNLLLTARERVADRFPGCMIPILNGDWDAGQMIRDEIAAQGDSE